MPEGSPGNRFVFDSSASADKNAAARVDVSAPPDGCESVIADSIKGAPVNLAQLLEILGVDSIQPLLLILNGSVIQADSFTTTQLADDDKLALMPPITAG